jgi:methyl acetate hydrolase
MTQFSHVDEVLGSAIDRGDVPGVVAMAATRDGVVYQAAFGRRALSDEAAMSNDTVFWTASMTKAITSAAAMQLVEQGKLALDNEIANASCQSGQTGAPQNSRRSTKHGWPGPS